MKFLKIILFVVTIVVAGCGKKENTVATANDGGINFTIQDLNGKTVSLSEYRGKTVLLNIWATWCGPCIREIPDLKAIHAEQQNSGVVVLGVLLDSDSPEKAKPIVENELQINYPVWYGDDNFSRQFQVTAFPTTVIIDKDGKIVTSMVGQQNKDRFMNALKKVGS